MTAPHTVIIAEAGVNHNGDIDRAVAMVEAAAKAGADAVKFQSFKADRMTSTAAPKADYQTRNTGESGGQLAMLKALELSQADHFRLRDACVAHGIEFMSTPFEADSARFLIDTLKVKRLKVASGEITNAPLLLQLARSGKPIILSTGMSTLDDVRAALGVMAFGYTASRRAAPSKAAFAAAFKSRAGQAKLKSKVTLLHCTSEYPAPADTIHLRAMDTLAETFKLPVGLSDHSEGIAVATAAVARGAVMIEKHFTLDKTLPGPDHKASLAIDELKAMIGAVRVVEQALGRAGKKPNAVEIKTRVVARKSLVAMTPIAKGESFTTANLAAKRPGGGVPPFAYWAYLGKRAKRAYAADEMIDPQ